MKHFIYFLVLATLVSFSTTSCDDENSVAVPIAPILKNVVFPNNNAVMPGQPVQIKGKGFASNDKVILQGNSETYTLLASEVTNEYIIFVLPKEAGGEYTVIIERDGLQTILDDVLRVPLMIALEDVLLPTTPVAQQGEVTITGKGFENGDIVKLSASFYPGEKEYVVTATLTNDGISFRLPQHVYGINTVIVTRGDRKNNLGTITIETNVGDVLGGGVVFWVSDNKTHGYICSKTNVGSATEMFGPEVNAAEAAGTSKTMGDGQNNTRKIIQQIADLRIKYGWPEWQTQKTAAEMCDDYSATGDDGLTYTDWFLPAREELIALFKVKALIGTKGATVPANNYWSSSEGDGETAGWSAYYVNFYEATQIISENASKSVWKIGIRPVRYY